MTPQTLDDILYPAIQPFHSGILPVSNLHKIYFEQCGNPNGKPVLFIHGGPGGGTSPNHRRYFNPDIYHIILVDQRGAGKSLPHAEIRENTTQLLIEDFEKIREMLNIKQWLLFGGSWGSTLGLAYAQAHPERVTGLILRGIFLGLPEDLHWMYQHGASEVFPEAWEKYLNVIPENERNNMIAAYHKQLTSLDKDVQQHAAVAWSQWEAAVSHLFIDEKQIEAFADPHFSLAFASIENHYFTNNLFLTHQQLLKEADVLKNIPTTIVHGRYDMCCPIRGAWQLKKAMPHAEFIVVPDAGHSMSEIGTARELVKATNTFASFF